MKIILHCYGCEMSFMDSKNIPQVGFKGIVDKKKTFITLYKYSQFNVLHTIAFIFFHDLNGRHILFVSSAHLNIHSFFNTGIEYLLSARLCSGY